MDSKANPGPLDSPAEIRLDQYLKLMGRVRSGGEAKHRIQAGEVSVNGVVETHRSRKLRGGEVVTLDGETLVVELPQEESGPGD